MLLHVKEAAQQAGVSAGLIYQWCEERRLPHYRPGGAGNRGKILIAEEDLAAFMQALRVEATEPAPGKKPTKKRYRHLE